MFRGFERPHISFSCASLIPVSARTASQIHCQGNWTDKRSSMHSLGLGFERKHILDMGRAGMQLSWLKCQPHRAFWGRTNQMVTSAARIHRSILEGTWTALKTWGWAGCNLSDGSGRTYPGSGHVLSRKDSVASSCFTQKEEARLLSLWNEGGYTLATHKRGWSIYIGGI